MRVFWQKVLESALVKVICNAAEILVSLAAAVVLSVNISGLSLPLELAVACLTVVIIVCILKWHFSSRYPPFRWDVTHNLNRYVLTFKDRENLEYTRHLNAKSMREGIKVFADGEYIWTGSDSKAELIDSEDFSLELMEKEAPATPQRYVVHAKNTLQAHRNYSYGLKVMLKDDDHQMRTQNHIFIKRPTKRITLELHVPNTVRITNVSYRAWTRFGDQDPFVDKKAVSVTQGGHDIYHTSYFWTIRRPKLFCEYAISWEWG